MTSLVDALYGGVATINDEIFNIKKADSRRTTPLDRDFENYSIRFVFNVQCMHREWAMIDDEHMYQREYSPPHSFTKTISFSVPKHTLPDCHMDLLAQKEKNYHMDFTVISNVLDIYLRHIEPRNRERSRMCARAAEDTMKIINSSPPRHDTFTLTSELFRIRFRPISLETPQGPHMVPATDEAIMKLERKVISATDLNTECAICLDELDAGREALNMPCSHAFHGDCIVKWLNTSHYCPLCRFEMPAAVSS